MCTRILDSKYKIRASWERSTKYWSQVSKIALSCFTLILTLARCLCTSWILRSSTATKCKSSSRLDHLSRCKSSTTYSLCTTLTRNTRNCTILRLWIMQRPFSSRVLQLRHIWTNFYLTFTCPRRYLLLRKKKMKNSNRRATYLKTLNKLVNCHLNLKSKPPKLRQILLNQ